jgi:acyl-CoA synthetase (AMP-forming)/AMP-acid ligase II
MNCIRTGVPVVVMEHFEAEVALECIERYKITHSQWVPTMFVRMLKLPEDVRLKYDVSSLQCAIHAAAPCPIPIKEQMIDWWGPVIYEYYAGTEGNGFVQLNSEEWLVHKGSVGKPLSAMSTAKKSPWASLAPYSWTVAEPSNTTKTKAKPTIRGTLRVGQPWATWVISTKTATCT